MRYEDRGARRGRRSRHLTFWSRLAPARSIYDVETVWTEGRLSVYFLCGNANKIYLEALCNIMSLSFDGNSRICLWPELSVEYVCPESFRTNTKSNCWSSNPILLALSKLSLDAVLEDLHYHLRYLVCPMP